MMRFTKMHGIGNDYIYINGYEEFVRDPRALARKIADRHRGVGGDGLILVLPPTPGVDAHVRMRMFNSDGSEAEMCGNGIRCVCKLTHDHGIDLSNPMRVETGNGVLSLSYTLDGEGLVDQVTVQMGRPELTPSQIPVNIPDLPQIVNHSIKSLIEWPDHLPKNWIDKCGLDQRMTCVSMGNPHVVLYCRDVSRVPLEHVGPVLENHPVFPKRINAHFVQVHRRDEVTMRTWERGSGATQACGTGAAAVCAAGVLTDHSDPKILAHLPGGDLTLHWDRSVDHPPNSEKVTGNTTPGRGGHGGGQLIMTGPATEVFNGTWPDED